jgi:hypothetical protein
MKKYSVMDSSKMQSVKSTEFREDTVWYHIKLKEHVDNPLSKTTFWLGGDSEEDIYKILKKKHKINKTDVEWIKLETPPFI